ncbi:MAG: hypothetical protein ACR2FM_05625 [Candidatus Saccharimonadales bacterium]
MPPQQLPPQQQNQYDFILNSTPKPPKQPVFGGSKVARVLVVVVGVVLLIVIGLVVNNFLNSGSKAQTQQLIEVAKAQTEIIRVSGLVTPQTAKELDTRVFALNTKLSTQGSSQATQTLLTTRGVKKKALNKTLAGGKNPKTDAALDEATKNNRFDDTYRTIIGKQLADYQTLLKTTSETANPKEKQALAEANDNVNRLITKLAARSPANR